MIDEVIDKEVIDEVIDKEVIDEVIDKEVIDEELIEVLYNACYGGWGVSKKAIELYKLRNVNFNSINSNLYEDELCRTDPILIQIYNELGKEFNGSYSRIQIKKIPKKYENYYNICEYDGLESIKIDYTNYNKLYTIYNKIKGILQSTNNNNIKINEITEFISTFEM